MNRRSQRRRSSKGHRASQNQHHNTYRDNSVHQVHLNHVHRYKHLISMNMRRMLRQMRLQVNRMSRNILREIPLIRNQRSTRNHRGQHTRQRSSTNRRNRHTNTIRFDNFLRQQR